MLLPLCFVVCRKATPPPSQCSIHKCSRHLLPIWAMNRYCSSFFAGNLASCRHVFCCIASCVGKATRFEHSVEHTLLHLNLMMFQDFHTTRIKNRGRSTRQRQSLWRLQYAASKASMPTPSTSPHSGYHRKSRFGASTVSVYLDSDVTKFGTEAEKINISKKRKWVADHGSTTERNANVHCWVLRTRDPIECRGLWDRVGFASEMK